MSLAFGKRQNPVWDALRVQSLNSLGGAVVDNASGSGVQNKIYVWHADGSTLDIFDPDSTGLNSAIGATATGDTIWLPSIPIALTAAITIPANITLIGISDKAHLSFSGFSGTAITLSADSMLFGFSLTFTATGTTAIGVNAQAARSKVEHIEIIVSGGSVKNVRVLTGVNITPSMTEMWTIDPDAGILWAQCDGSIGSSPAWNTITLPATFVNATLVDQFANSLQIDHLGHYLYVCGKDSGNSNRATVWQLTNLAAIRATPATVPIWAVIAYKGQAVSAGILATTTLTESFYMRCFHDALYLRAKGSSASILGIYNGSSWTWRTGLGANVNYQAVNGNVYANVLLTAGNSYLYDWSDVAIGGAFTPKFGVNHFSEIWRRTDTTTYYHFPLAKPDDKIYIREHTTNTEIEISNSGTNPQDVATIRGALTANDVYCVDSAGDLRISSNGTSFSNIATWATGWVMNTVMDGSGNLIWLIKSQTDTNPVVRLYDSAGNILSDLTGDLWTVLGHPGGTIRFDNLQIVYIEGTAQAADYPIVADMHAGSASGTGAIDIEADGAALILDARLDTLQVNSGKTVYVRDVAYTTHSGSGTIEPLWADRGAWDAINYQARHTNDADSIAGIHHTLGSGPTQAAPGDHGHLVSDGKIGLTDSHIIVGDASNIGADVAMSGDATIANTGALTLKNTGPGVVTVGDATHVAQTTLDAQGRVTALTSIAITIPVSAVNVYNETQVADGSSTIYYLINYAAPSTVRVYINGIRQPVTDDVSATDIVTFSVAPAAGALLMFDYEMETA